MNAFHINCTAPFFHANPTGTYRVEDFELLTTMLSALKWQEQNGSIRMVTDKVGAAYYRALGLHKLWDGGIDDTLNEELDALDHSALWAAGKLYALRKQAAPCVMLDTDFVIWKDISRQLEGQELVVAHREELYDDVYPPREAFLLEEGYAFPPAWDWEALPCNTAFAYFRDGEFKDYYTANAIAFMQAATRCDNPLTYMVFAEQRLLAMCAMERGAEIHTLLDMDALFEHQEWFTHIWGFKQEMRSSFESREWFCRRCIKRIAKDFPDWADTLANIPMLQIYTSAEGAAGLL